MAARTKNTAASEETPVEEVPVEGTQDDQPRNADGSLIPTPDEKSGDDSSPAPATLDTIPAVQHSAPAVENAKEISEKASPNAVEDEDGLAAFRPPQTQHTAWTLNTLHEEEGGSALGVEQTSGNADLTKDPADRTDEAE